MSTDEANAYLASPAVTAKRTALESAAKELYKLQRQNLDRLLESGRISKDFYDFTRVSRGVSPQVPVNAFRPSFGIIFGQWRCI